MTITNGYASLTDFKNFARISSSDAADDWVIENIIEAASRVIDNETRRTFYARTETHYYDVPVGDTLYIMDDDLLTVTTLTNGDATVLTTADYILKPNNATPKWAIKIKDSSSYTWEETSAGNDEQAITIVGTWGWSATAPLDIKQACLEIAMSYYHRFGENSTSETTITTGGVVITPRDIPAGARAVLDNYVRFA